MKTEPPSVSVRPLTDVRGSIFSTEILGDLPIAQHETIGRQISDQLTNFIVTGVSNDRPSTVRR